MRDVPIRDDVIRLGQLLKLAGLVDSGAEAKSVLAEGRVTVNDEPEARRGRQLRDGDVVRLDDDVVRVAASR
ncbi:MAG TPA: RNA-binding S4 domain-containing protein [Capillimicrobium sp.]